jgi:putative transcriptional regulator
VKKNRTSRMDSALLETTRDFHRGGLASASQLEKITVRVLGKDGLPQTPSLSSDDIKDLRARARISQAVLASCLGVTVGYLSRLERGEVSPSRPVARLLDIIRRKGLEAIL